MGFWIALMILVLIALLGCLVYLTGRFGKMTERMVTGVLCTAFLVATLGVFLDVINMVICILHLAVIWMLCDLAAAVIGKVRGEKSAKEQAKEQPAANGYGSVEVAGAIERKRKAGKMAGVCVLVITALYLSAAWYTAHHVVETDYSLTTDKDLGGDLKVALIADSHLGAVFDGDGFARHMETIAQAKPDILLVAGDYVDDESTKEDMVRSCEALGELVHGENALPYGVCYVFGNHDRGYYDRREFTGEELVEELEKNGVRVLVDEVELIDDRFYVIGREDRSHKRGRVADLAADLDQSKYMIVMDHQPHDYRNQAEAGVDLVVSGHTHGGQLFPFNRAGEWLGMDDKAYGHEQREKTDFVVTSGIGDWAIKFRTGCKAEFACINISEE